MFKKNKSWPVLILFFICIYTIGCAVFTKYGQIEKQARKQYEQGKYDAAFLQSISALRIKPSYDKAQNLLGNSYRAAVSRHEGKIEKLIDSSNKFKWDDGCYQ